MNYMSPQSLETPNGFKANGPLGGFLAGMNQDLANQMIQREFQDDDVARAIQQQELQKQQMLFPSQQATANLTQAQAQSNLNDVNSGTYGAAQTSGLQATTARNQAAGAQSNLAKQQAAAQLWSQFYTESQAIAPDGQPRPMDPGFQSWWSGWKQTLQPYAPKMPDSPDVGDMQQANQTGQQAQAFEAAVSQAQASAYGQLNSVGQQQRANITSIAPTIEGQTRRDVAATEGQTQRDVEAARAASAQTVANTNVQGREQVAQIQMQRVQQLQSKLFMDIKLANKNGWTPEDAALVEAEATEMFASSKAASLQGFMDLDKNPNILNSIQNISRAEAQKLLAGIPGYVAAKKSQLNGVMNGGSSSADTSGNNSGALPLPSSKDGLVTGKQYQTSRGVATWNGTSFQQ